jgi:hypothetical protein
MILEEAVLVKHFLPMKICFCGNSLRNQPLRVGGLPVEVRHRRYPEGYAWITT